MKKTNKGITLIALVVTIVILLILAAVSINLIFGEDGIVRRAQMAETKHNEASAKEKLELALLELQADKATKKEYNEQEYVDNKLKEKGMQVEGDTVIVEGEQFTINRNNLSIKAEGVELGKVLSSEDIYNHPAKYYGKEVEYSTKSDTVVASTTSIKSLNLVADADEELKNEGIKWKIFYADENNIYLIASDNVKVDGNNYYKIFDTAEQTLEYMNTKSNWEKYVGEDAEYALGGPSYTMFINSWNNSHPKNKINGINGDEEYGFNVDEELEILDELYFDYEDDYYGYWLASRSSTEDRYLVHASAGISNGETIGKIGSYGFAISEAYGIEANLMRFGFRPIVCLKSGISLQEAGNYFVLTEEIDESTQWSETYTSTVKGNYTDKSGNTATIPAGFQVSTEKGETEIETGLVIRNVEDGNEFVWVPVEGTGYDYDRVAWTRDGWKFAEVKGDYDDNSESYQIMRIDGTGFYFTEKMSDDERTSVEEYGGFYIGRYESGIASKTERTYNSGIEDEIVIKKGKHLYNIINVIDAKTKAESLYTRENDGVISKLCSSYAWDTALKFIETQNSTYPTNSAGGNSNVASGGTGVLQKTGYDETHPCNIYDMGGNVHEWTTEFYSDGESEYYVARGGTYDYGADSSPAAIRNGGSKNTTRNSDIGFRVALYL